MAGNEKSAVDEYETFLRNLDSGGEKSLREKVEALTTKGRSMALELDAARAPVESGI